MRGYLINDEWDGCLLFIVVIAYCVCFYIKAVQMSAKARERKRKNESAISTQEDNSRLKARKTLLL